MSSTRSAKPKIHQIVTLALTALTIIFMVFYGSLPVSYDYVVGSISDQDIYAPRTFPDSYETHRRAVVARDTSADVFVRSDKQSQECIDRVDDFFDLAEQARKNMAQTRTTQTPPKPADVAAQLSVNVEQTLGVKIASDQIEDFFDAGMSNTTFTYIREKTTSLAELIMLGDVSDANLPGKISEQITSFNESSPSYSKYSGAMTVVLSSILEPNTIYDEKATSDSANNAYNAVLNEPVMIEKGTKLVDRDLSQYREKEAQGRDSGILSSYNHVPRKHRLVCISVDFVEPSLHRYILCGCLRDLSRNAERNYPFSHKSSVRMAYARV